MSKENQTEKLVRETKVVLKGSPKIQGIVISELSLKKILSLKKQLASTIYEFQTLAANGKFSGDLSSDSIVNMLELVPSLSYILDAAIDKPKGFTENLGLADLMEVIAGFIETNDLERIPENFTRLRKLLKIKIPNPSEKQLI